MDADDATPVEATEQADATEGIPTADAVDTATDATEPGEPTTPPRATVLLVGATAATARRLAEHGIAVTTQASEADAVVRSTADPDAPVPDGAPGLTIVLAHAGGHALALRWLGAGARTVVPDGGEAAIADILEAARDEATPETEAAEGALDQEAAAHSLLVIRSPELGTAGSPVTSLVARRLHARWQTVLSRTTAQVVDRSRPGTLVIAWPGTDVGQVRGLVTLLAAAAEGLLPDGVGAVQVGAGLALPDDAPTEGGRRDLAWQAAEACLRSGRALLTVGDHLVATAEDQARDVLRTALRTVEDGRSLRGHGRRTADLATDLAARLGLPSDVLATIADAAAYHHLGLLGAGDDATCDGASRGRAGQVVAPHLGFDTASLLCDSPTSPAAWAVAVADLAVSSGDGADTDAVVDRVRAELGDVPETVLTALSEALRADAGQVASA